jgi:cephalosporin hydroxylase
MITIDLEHGEVSVSNEAGEKTTYPLTSPEAFAIVSRAWLRAGWDTKYIYSFTWLGRPIIQLPEDLIRLQEAVYAVKPTVIIETGIAHGGSLVFYAGLLKAMGGGRVIGVDVEIRPHNRRAIEAHELFPMITMIEGSSTASEIVAKVKSLVKPDDRVFIVLDSNHSKEHVLGELRAYADLVSAGSYIVALDGIMADLVGAPRTKPDWGWNNPWQAAAEFLRERPEFQLEAPSFPFNEGVVNERVTYFKGGWLKRSEAAARQQAA